MKIDSFKGDFRFLSNFYSSPVKMNITIREVTKEYIFPTSEHAYQAHKSTYFSDVNALLWDDSPSYAKNIGKTLGFDNIGWDESKVGVMRAVVRAKFTQNDVLCAKLLATEGVELIEGNTWNDKFWGVCDGVGKNWLGKILMEIREELK